MTPINHEISPNELDALCEQDEVLRNLRLAAESATKVALAGDALVAARTANRDAQELYEDTARILAGLDS
jgi:hypothetical protein